MFTNQIIWPANSRLQHTAKHSPVRSFDQQTAGYSIQPNIHQSDHLTGKQQATAWSQRLMLIVHQSDHLTSKQQATAYSQTFTSQIIWPANSRLQHTAKHSPVRSFDQQTAGYSTEPTINVNCSPIRSFDQQSAGYSIQPKINIHQCGFQFYLHPQTQVYIITVGTNHKYTYIYMYLTNAHLYTYMHHYTLIIIIITLI